MVKIKDTLFCMENLKMKRKKEIFLDFLEWGFEPGFSKIPAHDLNY